MKIYIVVYNIYSGIMEGYPTGEFKPEEPMTRAEVVVTLKRAISYLNEDEEGPQIVKFDEEGIYGPESGIETIDADVVILTENITLQNLVMTGDLLLAESIGEGDVTLQDVVVEGETIVQGGGANSVHVIDSELDTLIIDKQDGHVRVVASGSTTIKQTYLHSNVILEAESLPGDGFKEVAIVGAEVFRIIVKGEPQPIEEQEIDE